MQATRLSVRLAMILLLGECTGAALAQVEPESDSPQPVPKEIVTAWEKAGAKSGFMGRYKRGDRVGFLGFEQSAERLTDTVPAFRFMAWKNGVVKGLPVPSTPFGLDLHHSNISDSGVQELLSFKSLHTLDLANTNVTDAGIKDFSKLKGLHSVNLHGTKISIVGLKELAGLKLKKLGIPIALTDESLKHFLAALEPPTALRLFETQVTELGMKDLAGATSLQILDLGYLPVTDNGLKNLAGLTNLQTLDLRGTKVTGTGLSDLAGLKNLHTLNLSNNHVTEAGLKELARLNNLRTLHLGCIKISDAGLKEIVSLRNLEVLYLESTLLTSTQRTELRKALQNCLIR